MNPSREHETLVRALINHFINVLGMTVVGADLPEYAQKPFVIGSHTPDIIARDAQGLLHIGEAKYDGDIFSDNTKDEILEFSQQTMRITGKSVPLHLVVYKYEENMLINTLNNLGLGFKVGNLIKIWTL